jgi:hypothetical protein
MEIRDPLKITPGQIPNFAMLGRQVRPLGLKGQAVESSAASEPLPKHLAPESLPEEGETSIFKYFTFRMIHLIENVLEETT